MRKPRHGPSLYYATDKNIFDALNQHKVDAGTVARLFQRRNILVSKKTMREDLAKYFSLLTHDYYDHQRISARLGIASRRERVTSVDVKGIASADSLRAVVDQLKAELETSGDTVQVEKAGENLVIRVQYSEVDYRRSEFNQVQVKDGIVEFEKNGSGYTVRNTQNEYINSVRESILAKVEKSSENPLEKSSVSLADVVSAKQRSKFFYDLAATLPDYVRRDVTDVYVYKAKPGVLPSEENADEEPETHVERVFLRGSGVTRSKMLNELLDVEDYYIVKMGWTATEKLGLGNVYDIEVGFADPTTCTGFSYLVTGVFPIEDGKVSSRRRAPTKEEVHAVSRVIESKSREIATQLKIAKGT